MCIFAAIHGRAAERIVWIMLVQPVVLIQHRNTRCFQGWYVPEHIPHYFEMVIHFPAATHKESFCNIFSSVAASAGKIKLFQKVNVFAFHLTIPNEVKCCRKSSKTCSDDVSRFFVNILWLFRMCKRFISSCRVIHNANLLKISVYFELWSSLNI